MMPCSVVDHLGGGFQAASGEYEGGEFSILAMSSFTVFSAPVEVAWYTSASAATRYSAAVALLMPEGYQDFPGSTAAVEEPEVTT